MDSLDDILLSSAKEQYPILNDLQFGYKYAAKDHAGFLEFWPSEETGTDDDPRPKEFPLGSIGVEVRDPNTRPIDLMGDIASHHLVNTDPKMIEFYKNFESSLTPQQHKNMQRQYEHAKENYGETRPFKEWYDISGLPAYFRGYAFQQWKNADSYYTSGQRGMFDDMMKYLAGKPEKKK